MAAIGKVGSARGGGRPVPEGGGVKKPFGADRGLRAAAATQAEGRGAFVRTAACGRPRGHKRKGGCFCADRGLRAAAHRQSERRGHFVREGAGRHRQRAGGAEKIRKKCGDFITKRAIAQDFCAKELTKDLPTCYNSSRDCGRIFLRAPFCCEFFCFSDSRARVRRDPATCFLNCVRAI